MLQFHANTTLNQSYVVFVTLGKMTYQSRGSICHRSIYEIVVYGRCFISHCFQFFCVVSSVCFFNSFSRIKRLRLAYRFVYLFVCLFVCLFSFLSWNYKVKKDLKPDWSSLLPVKTTVLFSSCDVNGFIWILPWSSPLAGALIFPENGFQVF